MSTEPEKRPRDPKLNNLDQSQLQQRIVKSEDLFEGDREVLVLHRGEFYRLTQTRTGKLILTK